MYVKHICPTLLVAGAHYSSYRQFQNLVLDSLILSMGHCFAIQGYCNFDFFLLMVTVTYKFNLVTAKTIDWSWQTSLPSLVTPGQNVYYLLTGNEFLMKVTVTFVLLTLKSIGVVDWSWPIFGTKFGEPNRKLSLIIDW